MNDYDETKLGMMFTQLNVARGTELPRSGDRVIIDGWEQLVIKVKSVVYVPNEARYKISLDWGEYGESTVYDHDEETTWRRFNEVN